MTIAKLPEGYEPPATGWSFHGVWSEEDQAHITLVLYERIPNRTQALNDRWLFVTTGEGYYAHCPTVHTPGYGYREDTAAELADTLWGHYFTLRLGPLVLASTPPQPAATEHQQPTAEGASQPDFLAQYKRDQQALEHFHTAQAHIQDGAYAAAKQEMQLSLALSPANHIFDAKRLETLGDIESYLGDDHQAAQIYAQALTLIEAYGESWPYTELRLKLAWCAIRQQQMAQARTHIAAGIVACERGRAEDGGSRSLNALHGLALATMADWHLHQHDTDAALTVAHEASAIANRLGQSYGEKARLYLYLAWRLYLAGETEEARMLAKRAWAAIDRWLPVASAQTQMMRETLAIVLGGPLPYSGSTPPTRLPALPTLVATAWAAIHQMEDWLEQTKALHALAPYLTQNQLSADYENLLVWDKEDWEYFAPYRAIIEADLLHVVRRTSAESARIVHTLVTTDASHFTMLSHEQLYAEALLRIYHQVAPNEQRLIAQRMEACAVVWWQQISTRHREYAPGLLEALAALTPYLSPATQSTLISQLEAYLTTQLQSNYYVPDSFRVALPLLATFGAGQAIAETILEEPMRDLTLWIACLAHAAAGSLDLLREHIVEAALNNITFRAPYGSTTHIAELLCHIAPYLQGEEIHQALAFATPIRAIVPRVQALTALARVLPPEEREPILLNAWQAANRSKNADTTGSALTIVAVCVEDVQGR
jgi:hypothetical protein